MSGGAGKQLCSCNSPLIQRSYNSTISVKQKPPVALHIIHGSNIFLFILLHIIQPSGVNLNGFPHAVGLPTYLQSSGILYPFVLFLCTLFIISAFNPFYFYRFICSTLCNRFFAPGDGYKVGVPVPVGQAAHGGCEGGEFAFLHIYAEYPFRNKQIEVVVDDGH